MSRAPSPWTRVGVAAAGAVALRGDGVEVAGEQHERPVAARGAGEHAGVAERRAPRRRRRAARQHVRGQRAPRRATPRATSTSSSVRAARRSARSRRRSRAATMLGRRCATAASTSRPSPATSSSCTLHERRGPRRRASWWRRSTRPATSTRSRARSSASAARPWWRSTRRPGAGWTCSAPGHAAARAARRCPRRYERSRVCDALLFRRGLPLYPVPAAEPGAGALGGVDGGRLRRCSPRSAPLGLFRPAAPTAPLEGAGRRRARCASAGCARPIPTPSSARCSATARRRSARRGACSSGSPRCGCAGVVDDDGGLWHRTLDELDACAAAYAAYALADGRGSLGRRPARGRDRAARCPSCSTATRSCRRRRRQRSPSLPADGRAWIPRRGRPSSWRRQRGHAAALGLATAS